MPQVKLLCDVAEGGRSLADAQKNADAFGLGKTDPKYPVLKRIKDRKNPGQFIEFHKGLVVMMTDEGAAKWVERKIGEIVKA